jgi:hypothetical protein
MSLRVCHDVSRYLLRATIKFAVRCGCSCGGFRGYIYVITFLLMRLPVMDLIIDSSPWKGQCRMSNINVTSIPCSSIPERCKRTCNTALMCRAAVAGFKIHYSYYQVLKCQLFITVVIKKLTSWNRDRDVSHPRGPAPIKVRSVAMRASSCFPSCGAHIHT